MNQEEKTLTRKYKTHDPSCQAKKSLMKKIAIERTVIRQG